MAIRTTKSDIIWSYIGYFFNLCTNLLIMPFTLVLVPKEELGLWYTFLSVGALVNLLDFGFSNILVRNITYAWCGAKEIKAEGFSEVTDREAEPNKRLFVAVLSSCRYISLIIAGLALFSAVTFGTGYISFVTRGNYQIHYIYAWILYSIAIALNIYYNYWTSTLKGVGAIQQSQKAIIISKVAQIVLSLAGLYLGGGIIALAAAYLISGFIYRYASKRMLFRYHNIGTIIKQEQVNITKGEIGKILKLVWHNAKKVGIVAVGTFGITQSTTMISSAFIGLDATASYGLTLQIINVLSGVSRILFQSYIPMLTELKLSNKVKELFKKFSLSVVVFWLIYLAGLIGTLTIGIPFVKLIKSGTDLPFVMVLFMGIYMFLEANHSIHATYISLSNEIPYMKSSIISGVFIIILSLLSARFTNMGIYGLMLVQFIVQLVYNNWKWPYVVMKEFRTNILEILCTGLVEIKQYVVNRLPKH